MSTKCSLRGCLNNESGVCSLTEFPFYKIKANSKDCKFLDLNFNQTRKEFKAAGGIGQIIRKREKKLTESEIKKLRSNRRRKQVEGEENEQQADD